ncbi:MAG: hypothetical protein U0325_22840 [Polyangiales bacterium]
MTTLLRALLVAVTLTSCAQTVHGDRDAAMDGPGPDVDRAADVAPTDTPFVNTPGVACGPNRCRGQEICCNAACGVCAFPGECVDHGCAGQGGDGGR